MQIQIISNQLRPKFEGDELLPVVVWVHGGGFVQGTGLDTMFNMTKYAQDGILAVSINYRLGMFGFMNTFDEIENRPIGGNYGLMDIQVRVDR